MKENLLRGLRVAMALLLAVLCVWFLLIYIHPMDDISLDLSLFSNEDLLLPDPGEFDSKGWTVYTQEGETRTELTPNGLGGYTGLELGQTFYFSRQLSEDLDSPTLQIHPIECRFSIWLDDDLIYTDCPELDNRVGQLRLPMNDWLREDPITISLPADYWGKQLTIAQSSPEWTETGSVQVWPTSVQLYCGFAYESALISETFRTAMMAGLAFCIVLILLFSFVRSKDPSVLCLAVAAALWMAQQLIDTTFFYKYVGTPNNSLVSMLPLIFSLTLLSFLTLRSPGRHPLLWCLTGLYALSVIGCGVVLGVYPQLTGVHLWMLFFVSIAPYWISFAGLIYVLILGMARWRKENRFYRLFIPIAYAGILICLVYAVCVPYQGVFWEQLTISANRGSCQFLYLLIEPAIAAAALITAIAEAIQTELNLRAEQQLTAQHRQQALASYENLRRQHEEVMMLRHDMNRHFLALRELTGESTVQAYLDELIGQNKKIRPVVQSGNEMLDIILNGKLGAAADAGIPVEIFRAQSPETLPLSDVDLCSLIMNILDNAITAASAAAEPHIRLDIHVKNEYLTFICENTMSAGSQPQKKIETVPKHGLGLKIIRSIAARYEGLMDIEYGADTCKVQVALPLD